MWIGNYVLMNYGEGAVMAVPAHDERDFAFAKKYGIDIIQSVAVEGKTFSTDAWQEWYGDKTLNPYCVNSGKYDGLHIHEAIEAVAKDLKEMGPGRSSDDVPPGATGVFPVSATGARRFRSSTARSAVPFRFRKRICPCCCPKT